MRDADGRRHVLEAVRWSTGTTRRFWVCCSCRWESGPCRSSTLAVAAGEQHLQLMSVPPSMVRPVTNGPSNGHVDTVER